MKNLKNAAYVAIATLGFLPTLASAHVGYVLEEGKFEEYAGRDDGFLISAVLENLTTFLIGIFVTLAVIGLVLYMRRTSYGKRFVARAREKFAGYSDLLGWMARLSLGIGLIGAGTAGVFISPVLSGASAFVAFIELLLGFLFLLGLFTTPATLAAIVLFLSGLTHSVYLFGNFDTLGLIVGFFVLGTSRPGLDDIIGIPVLRMSERARALAPTIIRLGLGVAFIFLACYEKFLNPHDMEQVIINFNLVNVIPVSPALWVLGTGTVEFILGVLLVIGLETRFVAVVSFLVVSLTFFFFKESVYSHVSLFGALSMLVVLGAGPLSLDAYFEKKRQRL